MLQAGKLWVRITIRSLNFFILPYSSSLNIALDLTHPLTEMNTKDLPGVESAAGE
jgi:hypothetical protein